MRVLQVLPSVKSASGGPPRSTLGNCRALHGVDRKVETVLLTTDEHLEPAWREELVSRCPERMEVEVVSGLGQHTARFSLSLLRWIWDRAEDFDLAVIRALLHPISSAAARVASARGLRYLLVPHGTLSEYTFRHRRTALKRLYYRLVDARTVDGASALRFTARAEREQAERLDFDTPAAVIPHPYESRSDGSLSDDFRSDQVLFLARLDPVKGVDLLLEGMRIVQREAPGAKLVLAGSGMDDYEREVRSRVRCLGLEQAIELPGFVEGDQKRRLLSESTLFVLLSEQESFGMSVVEAMDAGLPVVVSKGVNIWPEIDEAEAGVVLDERSPVAAADAILRILDDRRARRAMGRRGREFVRMAFDPERVGRDVSRLYRAAAEGPGQVREEFS